MSAELRDEELDEMLGRHLAGRLDGQVGRADRGVAAEIARERRRQLIGRGGWVVGGLLAAAAAVSLIVVSRRDAVMPVTGGSPIAIVPKETVGLDESDQRPGNLEQVVWSRTVDAGTVFLDENTPVRKLVRHGVQTVSWTDPSGKVRIESREPVRDVVFVNLKSY